jgi:hypothetical protein
VANRAAPTVYGDAPVADGAVSKAARVFLQLLEMRLFVAEMLL